MPHEPTALAGAQPSAWHAVLDSPTTILADGIRYLRGGSLDRAWSSFAQAAQRSRDPRIRSEAYRRMADVKRRRAEWAEALQLTARAVRIASDHGLREEGAAARNIEGTIHLQRGDFERAITVYQEALAVHPGPHQRGLICQNLGTAFAQNGFHSEAADWYARSSEAFRVAGRPREELLALINQGNVLLDQGDFAAAEETFRHALRLTDSEYIGDAELQGLVEMNLAEALGGQGIHLDMAMNLVLSATGHFSASENKPYRVACHRVVALISEKGGDLDTAVVALERGLELAGEIGSGPELAKCERELARLYREYQHNPSE